MQVKLEQRRALSALKEKEMLNSEHQKTLLAKSKLESLCRELQKHSKMIKDEAMKRAQMEETKRKEVADSFQSTIDEVWYSVLPMLRHLQSWDSHLEVEI